MDLELNRKIRTKRKIWDKEYILEKLKLIRKSEDIDNITNEEVALILEQINNDYREAKEKTINSALETMYNKEKFKIFINKDKYIEKRKKVILLIIDSIKKHLSDKFQINNEYSLGYCKTYAYSVADAYKNTKNM